MKLAVLMGGIVYDSQKSILTGMFEASKSMDMDVFVFTCDGGLYSNKKEYHAEGEFNIYKLPELSKFDGVVAALNTIQNQEIVDYLKEQLPKLEIPVISLDVELENCTLISVDNHKSMYAMTEHMISNHGARRILYVSGPRENKESIDRLKGFEQAAKDYNVSDYEIFDGNFWIDSGTQAVDWYMKSHTTKPDAVICANDYMAAGATLALELWGYNVPDDVIISGYDNSYYATHFVPRLSTIEKPLKKIGADICKMLGGKKDIKNIEYEAGCIYSDSCGCHESGRISSKHLKRTMLEDREVSRRWAEQINALFTETNNLASIDEFINKLKEHVKVMGYEYFYLCLCQNLEIGCDIGELRHYAEKGNVQNEYTDYIDVVIAVQNGEQVSASSICKGDIVPDSFYNKDKSVYNIVMPIHFQLNCLGYCVIGNSKFPLEVMQFNSWIMNLGNAIENIRKHNLMKNLINRLSEMSLYDTMTGCLNRAGFYDKAADIIKYAYKHQKMVQLLFVDIDKLKYVNDTFGHEEGDFYIKSVANICMEHTSDNVIVMRYGGDEFIIFGCADEMSTDIMESIKVGIKDVQNRTGKTYPMDASIGFYTTAVDGPFKLEKLISKADEEMYKMKKSRKE